MPTMGESLWQIGKSPPQFLTFVVFGLFTLLAAAVLRSFYVYGFGHPAVAAAAAILAAVGGFFLATALFLGAYAGAGESGVAMRIAQLLGAVVFAVIFL